GPCISWSSAGLEQQRSPGPWQHPLFRAWLRVRPMRLRRRRPSRQRHCRTRWTGRGADYNGADACRQAEGLGLRCRSARGGLDELRRLNRPAVLLMRDDQGRGFHAALIALADKTATFAIGAEARKVALGALAVQWSGQYTLLWRMPPDAQETIRSGERGPAVQWLIGQLAQAQGRVADTGKDPLFDEVLERQVKQFQLAQGLIPDGAVGPQTVMRLAGVGDRSAPK